MAAVARQLRPRLLIVEDDEGLCSQYRWAFPDFQVLFAASRASALAIVAREQPPVVLMDLGLPPDPDGVSELGCVGLVVSLEFRGSLYRPVVNGVAGHPLDTDGYRLVHLIAHHYAQSLFAVTPRITLH